MSLSLARMRVRAGRLRRAILASHPAKLLLFCYLIYILFGWVLLALPVLQEVPVRAIDTLFIATSAVSTTGLVTVDPGTSFTFAGELVILALIQLGGLGYMTLGSFAVVSLQHRMSTLREKTAKAAFSLPDHLEPLVFVRSVVIFTLIVEAIGAAVLFAIFLSEGVDRPLWSAIFHAVSAFCTAGFSLFSTSLEAFRDDTAFNLTIAALSLLGATGFLIVVDAWRMLMGRARHLGLYSKLIVRVTFWFTVAGTVFLYVAEPTLSAFPPAERLMAAFFQTMTATTTVGFNTHPIGALSQAVLLVLIFLMVFGASPAGTGGGLKTTTFAALVGLVKSRLKGRDAVRLSKRRIPQDKLELATASLAYYFGVLLIALVLLSLTEAGTALDLLLFEAISAMGTVGLSMGITGDLTDLGKLVVIVLMTAGRVGILTFGIALAAHDESRAEEEDNELVL
ncbi:MAG: potassium transporter TrkG [Pseudomonadota bacterium]